MRKNDTRNSLMALSTLGLIMGATQDYEQRRPYRSNTPPRHKRFGRLRKQVGMALNKKRNNRVKNKQSRRDRRRNR